MKGGEILTIKEKQYVCLGGDKFAEITGFRDGVPVIKGNAITKDEGFDKDGNPKRSVEVNVPCAVLGVKLGTNG